MHDGTMPATASQEAELLHRLHALVPLTLRERPEFAWLPSAAADAGPQDIGELNLSRLVAALGLSEMERMACVLARASELEPRLGSCLASLQGDGQSAGPQRPTAGLLAQLCGARIGALLSAPAWTRGLLQWRQEELPLAQRSFQIHPGLLPLLCDNVIAASMFGTQRVLPAMLPDWPLPPSWQRALQGFQALIAAPASRPLVLVLRARSLAEASGAAAHLAARAGAVLARVEGAVLPPARDSSLEPGTAAGLEAWLLAARCTPLLVCQAAPGERLRLPVFEVWRGVVLVATGWDGDVEAPPGVAALECRLDLPPPEERAELLRELLAGHAVEAGATTALAHRHRCGISTLHAMSAAARLLAGESPVTQAHLQHALLDDVARCSHGLGALAQPVGTARGAAAVLVMPAPARAELDVLQRRCLQRERCADGRGAALRARYSPGVRALLIGASGTGKTLAATWLAQQLGKPLFRVDLASVSSKYIGETEKNLAQMLAAAEQLDCVLLFDEADSLFGNRTEVRQANDRFANTQTNYLLQRIETFEGIAILTSNSKARFDDAFMRRLDLVIEVPLPSVAERRELWLEHLGTLHALDAAQLNRLAAEIDLAGGHIRNIVLGGALAAGTFEVVRYEHLLPAVQVEYAKLGRRPPDTLRATG